MRRFGNYAGTPAWAISPGSTHLVVVAVPAGRRTSHRPGGTTSGSHTPHPQPLQRRRSYCQQWLSRTSYLKRNRGAPARLEGPCATKSRIPLLHFISSLLWEVMYSGQASEPLSVRGVLARRVSVRRSILPTVRRRIPRTREQRSAACSASWPCGKHCPIESSRERLARAGRRPPTIALSKRRGCLRHIEDVAYARTRASCSRNTKQSVDKIADDLDASYEGPRARVHRCDRVYPPS